MTFGENSAGHRQESEPATFHNCNRIGLRANPPTARWSLSDWLRRR